MRAATRFWYSHVSAAFIRGYWNMARNAPYMPASRSDQQVLLETYLLERALLDVRSEIQDKPDLSGTWVFDAQTDALIVDVSSPGTPADPRGPAALQRRRRRCVTPCRGSFAAKSDRPVPPVFPGLSGKMLSRRLTHFRCTVYALYAIEPSSSLRDARLAVV